MVLKRISVNNKSSLIHETEHQTTMAAAGKQISSLITAIIIFIFLSIAVLVSLGFPNASVFSTGYYEKLILSLSNSTRNVVEKEEYHLKCSEENKTQTCATDYLTTSTSNGGTTTATMCPSYFRWIHEDLRPWRDNGITQDMVEGARKTAHFRLVIKNGKAYVVKYRKSIQTRDKFTLWGILQLLRRYPGRLPDLDMMFDCDDRPVLPSKNFRGADARPPPLFRYCSDQSSLDIVFPDWSFWGWAETNIRPWKDLLEDIRQGNKRTKWKEREPYAYWKGNPNVAPARQDLMKCNVSQQNDWNTRLYVQDWIKESQQGYKQSNIEDQCIHRYKIYTEGWAWSVSEKYILACDSMTLYIKSSYHDFFIRGMQPLQHYWPIRENTKCTSLKFAVEWGNTHPEEAEAIGTAAGKFIHDDMRMDYIYDYMFHLLNEYSKLLRFQPEVPEGASELCPETIVCSETGNWKKFMMESLVTSPSDVVPCAMVPPFDAPELHQFLEKKVNATRQVETWENEYWQNINRKQ